MIYQVLTLGVDCPDFLKSFLLRINLRAHLSQHKIVRKVYFQGVTFLFELQTIFCLYLISGQAFLTPFPARFGILWESTVVCQIRANTDTRKVCPAQSRSICFLIPARKLQSFTSIQWIFVNVLLSILSMNRHPCKWSISCWMMRDAQPLACHTTCSPLGSSPDICTAWKRGT